MNPLPQNINTYREIVASMDARPQTGESPKQIGNRFGIKVWGVYKIYSRYQTLATKKASNLFVYNPGLRIAQKFSVVKSHLSKPVQTKTLHVV